ncbi:MAG: hypothetical protein M0Z28_16790, partial [Rhodospirillales bacterium]|nr:hypothetical protein [Rhodospirillales bacterium]
PHRGRLPLAGGRASAQSHSDVAGKRTVRSALTGYSLSVCPETLHHASSGSYVMPAKAGIQGRSRWMPEAPATVVRVMSRVASRAEKRSAFRHMRRDLPVRNDALHTMSITGQ